MHHFHPSPTTAAARVRAGVYACDRILSAPFYRRSARVGVYVACPRLREVDTAPLVRDLLASTPRSASRGTCPRVQLASAVSAPSSCLRGTACACVLTAPGGHRRCLRQAINAGVTCRCSSRVGKTCNYCTLARHFAPVPARPACAVRGFLCDSGANAARAFPPGGSVHSRTCGEQHGHRGTD